MDCDQILPNLYVGSFPRVTDIDTLKQHGITAVLNLQTEEDLEYHGINSSDLHGRYLAVGIEVRRVPILDFNDDVLRDKLPDAVSVLGELVDADGSVFVHCNVGVNRSPSTVICYLHWVKGWDLVEAENHVRKCRVCDPVMEVVRLATSDRVPG